MSTNLTLRIRPESFLWRYQGFRKTQKDRLLSLVGIDNFCADSSELSSPPKHHGLASTTIVPLRCNEPLTASSQLGADSLKVDVPSSASLTRHWDPSTTTSSFDSTYTRPDRRPLLRFSDDAPDTFAPSRTLTKSSNPATGSDSFSPLASSNIARIPVVRLPKSRAWSQRV